VSPGASLSGAFTALATAGLAAAATTPPESQASLCWSCRQRRAKPGVGGGVRGGGFGPPPPHEGQISTLPPSNLRLSQSCQALRLSWATPESGQNFSAFKACSRRQVVTGSASAGHTAKQNPRARRQLPDSRESWPLAAATNRARTQAGHSESPWPRVADKLGKEQPQRPAEGKSKRVQQTLNQSVCSADPAREFNPPAPAIKSFCGWIVKTWQLVQQLLDKHPQTCSCT
jgi:hypothetical protein